MTILVSFSIVFIFLLACIIQLINFNSHLKSITHLNKSLERIVFKKNKPLRVSHYLQKAILQICDEVHIDLRVDNEINEYLINNIPGIKPAILLCNSEKNSYGAFNTYNVLCSFSHEVGHHLSHVSLGTEAFTRRQNDVRDQILEELDAWALGRQWLENLFPHNRDLMTVFNKQFEIGINSYIKEYERKKTLDIILKIS